MKYILTLVLLFVGATATLFAQGEIDNQTEAFVDNDQTLGIQLKSNGYGLDYHYGKYIDGYRKRIYEVDMCVLKHKKEIRRQQVNYYFTGSFIYGKMNSVMTIKGGTGKMRERYSKRDKNSVSINSFYIYGPSVALIKPIYYEIYRNNDVVTEKFDYEEHQPVDIVGTASFLKGVSEITLSPGAYFKYGYNFDYSKRTHLRRAIEVGIMAEGYLLGVPIMAETYNPQLFFNVYLGYRFGSVIE